MGPLSWRFVPPAFPRRSLGDVFVCPLWFRRYPQNPRSPLKNIARAMIMFIYHNLAGGAFGLLRVKEREFAPLCNLSIEDLVPADHFYRFLDAKLDLAFVRDWVRDRYAERGRPAVDPVVFFKLQLVMFFEGVRSERELV